MLAIACGLIAAVVATLWMLIPWLTRRLLFKPERGPHDLRPPEFPPDVYHTDLSIETPDGHTLHGWLVSRQSSRSTRGVLLICHGNRGSIARREDTALFYLDLGLDVCLFDYRGYGRSTGSASEEGTYKDVDAVWAGLLNAGYQPENIVLLGRSLGGAVAAHLATHARPAAVIIESTFSSVSALASELYPRLYRVLGSRTRYDTANKVAHFQSPLLLVHSREDELIGLHHAKALLEAAPDTTELVTISGRHRDGFVTSRQVYLPAIAKFIDQHLGASSSV